MVNQAFEPGDLVVIRGAISLQISPEQRDDQALPLVQPGTISHQIQHPCGTVLDPKSLPEAELKNVEDLTGDTAGVYVELTNPPVVIIIGEDQLMLIRPG